MGTEINEASFQRIYVPIFPIPLFVPPTRVRGPSPMPLEFPSQASYSGAVAN